VSLVLDSSVTLAWVYAETTSSALDRVFNMVADGGGWVPGIWRLEVANILEMGVRKGRSNPEFRDAAFADLSLLPIFLDLETDRQAWGASAQLAAQHRLTLYDAAYLELARRRGLPLATLDRELRSAADREGIALLGTDE
jgi:predicted nucleic acid-binding protein